MGVLFIFAASLLWALDTLIRYPLIYQGMSASKLVFSEHVILVVLMSPVLVSGLRLFKTMTKKHLVYFAIIGGLGSALATLSFTQAFSLINPSLVILLQKFQPVVAILLAWKVLGEPLHKKFLGWALLCLLGGVLISYDDVQSGLNILMSKDQLFSQSSLMGYFLTLVAVVGWGASTVFGKDLVASGYKEKEVMAGRFFFGFLFLLPVVAGSSFQMVTEGHVWAKIFVMVLVSGFLGMGLYYLGLKRIPARLCALAEMFFPFCAIAVNWIFLEATLAPLQLLGGALLLIGSTVIQLNRY